MNNDIEKIILREEQIAKIVERLGGEITEAYKNSDKKLMVVCVLKGSLIFVADLVRRINLPLEIDFVQVSSYGSSTTSQGLIKLKLDLPQTDLSDFDVLIAEDILDTGKTLAFLCEYLGVRHPASIKICTLLDKPERRKSHITADFSGCEIADEFVVGYGLDYADKYRNLPYIGVLKEKIYAK